MQQVIYICDTKRHLVCLPYSKKNLHEMANRLSIKRCWFHKSHYDIPKGRIKEITQLCIVVKSKVIVQIIKKQFTLHQLEQAIYLHTETYSS